MNDRRRDRFRRVCAARTFTEKARAIGWRGWLEVLASGPLWLLALIGGLLLVVGAVFVEPGVWLLNLEDRVVGRKYLGWLFSRRTVAEVYGEHAERVLTRAPRPPPRRP